MHCIISTVVVAFEINYLLYDIAGISKTIKPDKNKNLAQYWDHESAIIQ